MKPTHVRIICMASVLCLLAHLETAAWVHPGILNNKTELEFIKKQVNSGVQPWKSGYDALLLGPGTEGSDGYFKGYLEHTAHPDARPTTWFKGDRDTLHADGRVAYGCALIWYIKGDERYAKKAIEIIDAWTTKLTGIGGKGGNEDGALTIGGLACFIYAAEILKYNYSGWTKQSEDGLRKILISSVFPPVTQVISYQGVNRAHYGLLSWMSGAIFLDDRVQFEHAVESLKKNILGYIDPDGKAEETCRDMTHLQMGLGSLANMCEMAWKQGIDVYSYGNNRVWSSLVHHVNIFLGTQTTDGCGIEKVGKKLPWYELTYNHYHNRKGLESAKVVELIKQAGPERLANPWGWGTLLHHGLPITTTSVTNPANGFALVPNNTPKTSVSSCFDLRGRAVGSAGPELSKAEFPHLRLVKMPAVRKALTE